ncbi:MAG: hypothetical protein EXR72_10470 [Myxococcales bacterium]|nr:hypothetical protein [Myxococcales bacterium]
MGAWIFGMLTVLVVHPIRAEIIPEGSPAFVDLVNQTVTDLLDLSDCLQDGRAKQAITLMQASTFKVHIRSLRAGGDDGTVPAIIGFAPNQNSPLFEAAQASARNGIGTDSVIYWNSTHAAEVFKNSSCAWNPMASLAHELQHAWQISEGALASRTVVPGTVAASEEDATGRENIVRRAMGICMRPIYGGLPLPAWTHLECECDDNGIVGPIPAIACGGAVAPKCCAHHCVDADGDKNNCGACNNACQMGDDPICCGGTCVDPLNDENNCGGCGSRCGAEMWSSCCEGFCTVWDIRNCGACGNDCGSPPQFGCCAASYVEPIQPVVVCKDVWNDSAYCNCATDCTLNGQLCSYSTCVDPE